MVVCVLFVVEDEGVAALHLIEKAHLEGTATTVSHEESSSHVPPAKLGKPANSVGAIVQEVSALGIGGLARRPLAEGLALVALFHKILCDEAQRLSACCVEAHDGSYAPTAWRGTSVLWAVRSTIPSSKTCVIPWLTAHRIGRVVPAVLVPVNSR